MRPSASTSPSTNTSTRLDDHSGDGPGAAPFGINLVGHASSNFSLSISLRHIARALVQRGVPVCIYDLTTGGMPHGPDPSLQPHCVGSLRELPYAINLICVSVLALPVLLLRLKEQELDWNRRLNVAVVFWELPVIPRHLVPVLGAFDVLLCGSWFVREAVAAHVPGALALTLAYPMALPHFEREPRSTFGIPGDAFVFYFSFDPVSGPDRKNPGAVVDAFRQAFPTEHGVHLVVKLNVPADAPQPWPPGVQRFLAQCKGDARITVLTRTGSYAQALATCEACCDCFVSLHRAEGLGMGPMEAMLLGKPVIMTAWSGSMSYATASSACLVPHAFVRPDGWDAPQFDAAFVGQPVQWAEPSIAAAAHWMRRVATDAAFRSSIASRGQQAMRAYAADAAQCSFVDDLAQMQGLKQSRAHIAPTLDVSQRRIRRARRTNVRLHAMQFKRKVAAVVPGAWRLLRWLEVGG